MIRFAGTPFLVSAALAFGNLLWTYYIIKVYCPKLSQINRNFRKKRSTTVNIELENIEKETPETTSS